jgi:glycogen(starch) synthase
MNVALISPSFPPYDYGGISTHCYDLAYSLSKNGVKTTVFCGGKHVTNEKLNANLEVFCLPLADFPPRHLWFQLRNYKALSTMLEPQTILHGHQTSAAFCTKLKKNLRKPLVVTVHSLPYYDLDTFFKIPLTDSVPSEFVFDFVEFPLNEMLLNLAMEGSDHIVACGSSTFHHIKTMYRNLPLDRISVIPNGINFDKMDRLARARANTTHSLRTEESKDKIRVFFCGRLYWRKGIIQLVEAMSELTKETREVELKVFGGGPLRGKVLKLISRLKLGEYVNVAGIVSYSDLIEQLVASDIAAFPSFYEVGPFISALEAMAYSKPTLVFDFPFAREFITHMSNGILVKPGDVKDLSDKLYLLAKDTDLRRKLGKNAFDNVKKNYNWDFLVKKYIDLYKSLSD